MLGNRLIQSTGDSHLHPLHLLQCNTRYMGYLLACRETFFLPVSAKVRWEILSRVFTNQIWFVLEGDTYLFSRDPTEYFPPYFSWDRKNSSFYKPVCIPCTVYYRVLHWELWTGRVKSQQQAVRHSPHPKLHHTEYFQPHFSWDRYKRSLYKPISIPPCIELQWKEWVE